MALYLCRQTALRELIVLQPIFPRLKPDHALPVQAGFYLHEYTKNCHGAYKKTHFSPPVGCSQ